MLWQSMNGSIHCAGLENIPEDGVFVLALNHLKGTGMAVGLIAAVLTSLKERRADLVDEVVVLAGVRDPVAQRNIIQRWGRAVYKWANSRWSKNLVHIPMAQ